MTGFTSKRQVTADKLDDDDAQGYIAQFEEALQKEYQRGYDAGKASQPKQEPLTDEAKAVIAAAKVAMDASFETENRELDISIPAHLATALSLRLDEFEAALRSKNHD